jgi:hypothetical protein
MGYVLEITDIFVININKKEDWTLEEMQAIQSIHKDQKVVIQNLIYT